MILLLMTTTTTTTRATTEPMTLEKTLTAQSQMSHVTQSTQPTETSLRRERTNESSLLKHLELDEEEDRAWRSMRTPTKSRQCPPVPASCFPSLRGKISSSSTPSTPPLELEDKIHHVIRAQATQEERPRYSVYVTDTDYETHKGKWTDKFHNRSISEVFSLKKSKGHQSAKSVS